MSQQLSRFHPEVSKLEQSPYLCSKTGEEIGFQVVGLSKEGEAIAGGTATDPERALRIALAEMIERAHFLAELQKVDRTGDDPFELRRFPTSCGFAAGFSRDGARYRSVCEGVERWAWEQWIDRKKAMPIVRAPRGLSPLARELQGAFEAMIFFQKTISVQGDRLGSMADAFRTDLERGVQVQFGVVLGLKGRGVYPGSRVSVQLSNTDWEHALIEAHRHLEIATTLEKGVSASGDVFEQRIRFFHQHRDQALRQIDAATNSIWPDARVQFLRQIPSPPKTFVYRSLCESFSGWHLGDEARFVF
jgi:hypothetical protein